MSRPAAYKGNDPYIFVSYCHKDDTRVWPMIEGLQARGLRVWYDEGIEWGSHWDQVIFEHLSGCSYVVAFVTKDFLRSENCMDEISYAKEEQKGPFIVFLDNLELTGMMKFRYGRIQALNLHQFTGTDALDNLVDTQILSVCRSTASRPVVQQTAPAPKPAPQQTVPACQPSRPSDADLKEWNRKGNECYNRQEYVEAINWYRKAAEQGYAWSQYRLAFCYLCGEGTEKDEAQAVKWFSRAAEQGHAAAQFSLGVCYENGEGTAKNNTEAVRWYRKAAQQGHMKAQYCVGYAYGFGEGIGKDAAEAVKWFRKAAEQGHARSQYELGACYRSGSGVPRDDGEAVKWYRKAADQGDMWGAFYLADCYAHGIGVPKDKTEALKWFQVADKHGHPWAKEQIKQLSWY